MLLARPELIKEAAVFPNDAGNRHPATTPELSRIAQMRDQQVSYPSEHKDKVENVPYTFNSPDRLNSHRRVPFSVNSLSIADAVPRKLNRVMFDVLDVVTFFVEEVMRATSSNEYKELLMTQIMNVRFALLLFPGPGPFADGDVVFLNQLVIHLFNVFVSRNNAAHVVPISMIDIRHGKLLYEGIL